MKTIKKLGVMSVAKLQAAIGAVLGIFIGLIFAIIGTATKLTGQPAPFAGLGFFAIIVFPIIYGIGGFVFGAIGAWLYNIFAKWFGGIEIELEK